MSTPAAGGLTATPSPPALLRRPWFLWPLALRVLVWLVLGHSYEMAVFQDASWQMVAGQGVYGRFAPWLASAGDGYYAAPPLYALMLWLSGAIAAVFGSHWWLHQLLIKSWLLFADLAVMAYLLRRSPEAARGYWTLWFVPVVAIGQVQPDLWAGLGVLAAFHLASRGQWMGAGAALGAAAAIKPVPLVILPFLTVYLVRTDKTRVLVPLGFGVLAALAAGWLPYLLLFSDAGRIADVIRFHAERPVAGLTIPSGLLTLANAALAVAELAGAALPRAAAAYEAAVRASAALPAVTLGVFVFLLGLAISGRPWSVSQTFSLPLLAFLAANKVVHEHYLLLALPLLLATGVNLRGAAIAFSVYLLAAGSPLRYLPSQYGVPAGPDAWLPPPAGVIASLGLAVAAGGAALASGVQILRLSLLTRDETSVLPR
jgi:hypothetical protein